MAKQEKHQCEKMMYGEWGRKKQCSRNGKYEREGAWYCKQHDPVSVKAKDREMLEERQRSHAAEVEARQAEIKREARRDACEEACEGYADPMELRNWRRGISSQVNIAIRHLKEHHSLDTGIAYLNDILADCEEAPK